MTNRSPVALLVITLLGLSTMGWLLLTRPAASVSASQCSPALNIVWESDNLKAFEAHKASRTSDTTWAYPVLNVCSAKQNTRLALALLVTLPTGIAAGMLVSTSPGWRRRS